MKVALFGGSFNPPHIGHFLVCDYVLRMGLADKIYILPVSKHPFGKTLFSFEHRGKMCEILFNGIENVEVKNWEFFNKSGNTIDLLKWIILEYPDIEFKWIIGSDCLSEKYKWKDFDEIEKMVDIISVGRFGMGGNEISSTFIRKGIIEDKDISQYIPIDVLNYFYLHKLDLQVIKKMLGQDDVMSEEELERQRRSIVYGNVKTDNEYITREMVDEVAEKRLKEN